MIKVMWLEIIHIRTTESRSELLIGELTGLLSSIREEADTLTISLFRHAALPADISLHLVHQSDREPPGKSNTGLRISSAMREYGMVDHGVWVMEYSMNRAPEA